MLVLALDTSTAACSVALVGVDAAVSGPGSRPVITALAGRVTVDARRHGEVLAPSIAAVLAEAGARPADLGAVVVGTGPGPFTSLRVGMVTGAAIGAARGIPVHGVCSLDALAGDAAALLEAERPGSRDAGRSALAVATDARRREVYWAAYRPATGGSDEPERIIGPAVDRPPDAAARMREAQVGSLFGPGATLYAEAFAGFRPPPRPVFPSPAALVRIVAAALFDGGAPAPLVPLYLRRPDAALPSAPKAVTA